MAHKLEIEWLRLAMAGRHPEAYRCFLQRQFAPGGMKGLYEFASEPVRAKTALPALLRYTAGGPMVEGQEEEWKDNWSLSRGMAFEMHFGPMHDRGLLRAALVEMARKLWERRLQVWGDALNVQRSLAYVVHLYKEQMNGTDTNWTAENHQGPLDGCGFDSCETLWVRADTGGQDFEASFGMKLDEQWAASVRKQIIDAFAEAAAEVVRDQIDAVQENVDEAGAGITSENAAEVTAELAGCLELRYPMDLHEAWCRQQVLWVASHASFRIKALRAQYPGATYVRPMPDGSLSAVTWRAFPFPERAELIETLWPKEERDRVSESMPASLEAGEWEPYLVAWCREAMNLIMGSDPRALQWLKNAVSAPEGTSPGVVIDVDHQVISRGVAHERAREWIERYASVSGILIRYHEGLPERSIPSMDGKSVSQIMSAFVDHLGDLWTNDLEERPYFEGKWPSDRVPTIVPKWHDGRLVSLEQALFGDQGMHLVNHVDDWPEDLPATFGDTHRTFGGENEKAGRGPANMLRRGLGTWINRAISGRGQELLYRVLTERSPGAIEKHESIGPMLESLSKSEALGIAQLLVCDATRDLWGYEFSWNVAFALGGSNHSAIEVRSALQERMRFTNISDEMPGWTLRGPSELSFMLFANELVVGKRKFSDRSVERVVIGAYIWSQEVRVETGEHVPFGSQASAKLERDETKLEVAIALVGWDRFEGKETDRGEGRGWSSALFKQFRWSGLDPEMPLVSLIETLSTSLDEARQDKNETRNLYKSETHEEDSAEETRHDREAFVLTMKELAKVLLYMQMREARIEKDDKAYGDNVGRGEHPLLPPKNKDQRAVRGKNSPRETVLHKIRVGPIKFDEDIEKESGATAVSGHKVRPHPRMGHIRNQACGPAWRDQRPVWIKPQWIGMKGGIEGLPRLYDVG